MKDIQTIAPNELLFELWASGYQIPEEALVAILSRCEAKATVAKRIKKSEAIFVDSSITILPESKAAFITIYARYTSKRGYAPLIRNDWAKFQRELTQLQTLTELKKSNIAMELESIFASIFKRFVKEREFKQHLATELQERLNALQLNDDINAATFKQLQAAYIKMAESKGLHEYVKMAVVSLEPFAKLVDLADMTGADLTDLFYAQFHINWGREFPKPSNLYDGSAYGRYADYRSKLKNQ